jgi:hypothetical protein
MNMNLNSQQAESAPVLPIEYASARQTRIGTRIARNALRDLVKKGNTETIAKTWRAGLGLRAFPLQPFSDLKSSMGLYAANIEKREQNWAATEVARQKLGELGVSVVTGIQPDWFNVYRIALIRNSATPAGQSGTHPATTAEVYPLQFSDAPKP